MMDFGINDTDAIPVAEIDGEEIVLSIAGKVKFVGETTTKTYNKNGRQRSDKMREALFSDGSKTIKLTIWSDLIEILTQRKW